MLPSSTQLRILGIVVLMALAHLLVRGIRRSAEWFGAPARTGEPGAGRELALRRPGVATMVSLISSALVFTVYFVGVGLLLREFGISVTAYFATATVIGLAVGFGSQGLVQDVVTGLTLIFSDVIDIGDMVEISGQVGRVQTIGLRFTTLVNFQGVTVYIPNRGIGVMGRYRRAVLRAYVDVRIPPGDDAERIRTAVKRHVAAFRQQFRAAVVTEPEIFGVLETGEGGWRYLRLKLRMWPGQQALVENVLVKGLVALVREEHEGYPDWMVTVTYRVA